MRYTNKYNLPEPLFKALTNDTYSRHGADISVTSIIKSPREFQLTERHKDELVEDAADLIFRLLGNMGHLAIERSGCKEGNHLEKLLFIEVDGLKIKGQPDYLLLLDNELCDWKFSSVWSVIYGKPEWGSQLNIYGAMCEKNTGVKIEKLSDWVIIRDWSRAKARFDTSYPQIPFAEMKQEVWGLEKTMEFVRERVKLHKDSWDTPDNDLPPCTEENRWVFPATYAVMKNANKRAIRVLDTPQEANRVMEGFQESNPKDKYRVETRRAKWRKCEDGYCIASEFCNQFKKYMAEK